MKFKDVSIVIPALREVDTFIKTIDIILDTVNKQDIKEVIPVVCERTTKECIEAIELCKTKLQSYDIPLNLLWQTKPFAGGAVNDGMMYAKGSHTAVMSADTATDPERLCVMIDEQKKHPNDIISASRWLPGGGFINYNPVKKVWNYITQKGLAIFYGCKLTDFTFGYHVGPTKIWQSINWEEYKHPFFLEETLKPLRLGVNIYEVPAKFIGEEEESVNSFMDNFKYLRIAFRVRFMKKSSIMKPETPNEQNDNGDIK